MKPDIGPALGRLREAASQVAGVWPGLEWKKVAGPGPDTYELKEFGFPGMVLEPGKELKLSCRLDLPDEFAGVSFAGQPLEMTVNSLYPVDVSYEGRSLLNGDIPTVALGPALIRIVDELKSGDNGELSINIRPPHNQVMAWVWVKLTTPALRERAEVLDIAWAQLVTAHTLAASDEDFRVVVAAASVVPETLPTEESELKRTLGELSEALTPFHERAAQLKVHLIGHSHIDMNWLWTWKDTVEVLRRDFRSIVAMLEDYPEMRFTHSQPATYEVIKQEEPELFKKVQGFIQSGRWEPATMTWVEGDTNMASGEAMARQLLEGVRYTREELGADPAVFMAPDTFGHAGNLPQLAQSAGAISYYHHRCNPGQDDRWPAYWWEGQDGSRILGISTGTYNGEITAGALALAAAHAYKHGHTSSLHFFGVGDHGGGPTRQSLDALRRIQKVPGLPHGECSSLESYSREIIESEVPLPVHRGESRTVFEGCYTTHADTKLANRLGENLLVTADTLAAAAGIDAAGLQDPWRRILFHQFHDILDGSAIHEAYEHTHEDLEHVIEESTRVIAEALDALTAGEDGDVLVVNPCGFERDDVVVVPDLEGEGNIWLRGPNGSRVPAQYTEDGLIFVANVRAFGTASYSIDKGSGEPESLEAVLRSTRAIPIDFLGHYASEGGYFRVDTDLFDIFVRRDCGIITSFIDKRVGRELVSYGMRRSSDYADTARVDLALGVLQLSEELPHGMTAWHLDEVHKETSFLRGATTEIVEAGAVRLILETVHNVEGSSVRQRTIFYRNLPRVDYETHLDWKEVGDSERGVPNLKIAFTARTLDCEAWFETPFGAVRRPADGQEVPALRWADAGGEEYGVALVNDSKYGYDILGNRIRLSLVRSAYDPDAISDAGEHEIRYSLYPHPGDWRSAGVVRVARGFNQPLIGRVPSRSLGGSVNKDVFRPTVSNDSVMIECLRNSYGGQGRVIRLYEPHGSPAKVEIGGIPSGAGVWETNLAEDKMRKLDPSGGPLALELSPWQVVTLLIE
ncbi:MAG TPA: glycoside hydrolase family 38 C-terminal domain-containing protein [Actinomycetota bacterium]|nr:glycoside hydrolase family 38 C-terminal domain-containing protein [Actinomycetota bacterium]